MNHTTGLCGSYSTQLYTTLHSFTQRILHVRSAPRSLAKHVHTMINTRVFFFFILEENEYNFAKFGGRVGYSMIFTPYTSTPDTGKNYDNNLCIIIYVSKYPITGAATRGRQGAVAPYDFPFFLLLLVSSEVCQIIIHLPLMIILPRLYSGRIPPPPPPPAERPFSRLAQHQGILLPLTNTQPPPLSNMIIMRTDMSVICYYAVTFFYSIIPPPPPKTNEAVCVFPFSRERGTLGVFVCLFVCLFVCFGKIFPRKPGKGECVIFF